MKICPGPGGSSRRWAGCPLEVGERLYFDPVDTHSFINIENSPLSPFSTFVFYFVFLWYVKHEAEKFFPDWFKSDALSLPILSLCYPPLCSPSSSAVSPPQPFSLQLSGGIPGSGWRESHESPGFSPLLIQPEASTFQQRGDYHCTGPGATQWLAVWAHWQQPAVGSRDRKQMCMHAGAGAID